MTDGSFETLSVRASENLVARKKELSEILQEENKYFKTVGIEIEVWLPTLIHSADLGGISAYSYLGYAKFGGQWGLAIRIIEKEPGYHGVIQWHLCAWESIEDARLAADAIEKIPELKSRLHNESKEFISCVVRAKNPPNRD